MFTFEIFVERDYYLRSIGLPQAYRHIVAADMQTSTAQPPQQPAKHSQAVLRKLVTGVPAPAAAGGAARSARWVSDEVATKQVKSQPDLRTSAQSGSVRERAKQYEQRCVSSSSNDGPSLRSRPPKQQAVSKAVAADDGEWACVLLVFDDLPDSPD